MMLRMLLPASLPSLGPEEATPGGGETVPRGPPPNGADPGRLVPSPGVTNALLLTSSDGAPPRAASGGEVPAAPSAAARMDSHPPPGPMPGGLLPEA